MATFEFIIPKLETMSCLVRAAGRQGFEPELNPPPVYPKITFSVIPYHLASFFNLR